MLEEKQFKGRVKWFDDNKGFGFIESEEMEGDVFVHYKAVEETNQSAFKTLKEGQLVGFQVTKDNQGRMKALKVIKL